MWEGQALVKLKALRFVHQVKVAVGYTPGYELWGLSNQLSPSTHPVL